VQGAPQARLGMLALGEFSPAIRGFAEKKVSPITEGTGSHCIAGRFAELSRQAVGGYERILIERPKTGLELI
jgi:hypothetical protein